MNAPLVDSVAAETLDRLRQVSTASAWSTLVSLGVRRTYMRDVHPIAPLGTHHRVVGRAVTLRYLPLREDVQVAMARASAWAPAIRQALETLAPQDVLVIDAMGLGSREGGVLGDIMVAQIKHRGAVAIVTDGAIRDTPFIREMGLPVFARGMNPGIGSYYHVDVNTPVQCGGVLVMPGDILLADDEGVLVVPHALAAQVAQAGLELENLELFIRSKVEQGIPLWDAYPPNETLRQEYEATRQARQ